jgi:hypothetical protein
MCGERETGMTKNDHALVKKRGNSEKSRETRAEITKEAQGW